MKYLVGLLVVLVIAVGAVVFYLDRIVATAIEQSGTYALGVETGVDSVSIGLLSGRSAIRGLAVANPPGFERPHFLRMEEGSVDLRFNELLGDPVAVQRLAIRGVDLSLERRGGQLNYAPILKRLDQLAAEEAAGAAPAEEEAGPAKGFVIREVVIEGVRAHVDLVPSGGKLTKLSFEVPEIRLENVGSESEGGVQLTELTRILTTAVLEAVASQRGKLPSGLVGDLKGRLRDLPAVAVELPRSADDLKGLSDSGSGVVEEGKKAVEGLKGLLRKE
jgi:hypothetical protein